MAAAVGVGGKKIPGSKHLENKYGGKKPGYVARGWTNRTVGHCNRVERFHSIWSIMGNH